MISTLPMNTKGMCMSFYYKSIYHGSENTNQPSDIFFRLKLSDENDIHTYPNLYNTLRDRHSETFIDWFGSNEPPVSYDVGNSEWTRVVWELPEGLYKVRMLANVQHGNVNAIIDDFLVDQCDNLGENDPISLS